VAVNVTWKNIIPVAPRCPIPVPILNNKEVKKEPNIQVEKTCAEKCLVRVHKKLAPRGFRREHQKEPCPVVCEIRRHVTRRLWTVPLILLDRLQGVEELERVQRGPHVLRGMLLATHLAPLVGSGKVAVVANIRKTMTTAHPLDHDLAVEPELIQLVIPRDVGVDHVLGRELVASHRLTAANHRHLS